MRIRMALAAVVLCTPAVARAQTPTDPEHVLPAKSQLYYRWDGANAHRAEFEATPWGKTLKGDTGKFFTELWSYFTDNVSQAIDQFNPQAAGIFKDTTKALGHIGQSGVVVGIELTQVKPVRANAVFVFPGAAGEKGTLLPLIQQAAQAAGADVKEEKVGQRPVHRIEIDAVPGGLHLGWWPEGTDAVFMVGTDNPTDYVKSVDANKTGIARHPLYQKLRAFKGYTTASRGYLDVQGLAGAVEDLSPQAAKLVDALGVKGVKNLTLLSGYDKTGFRDSVDIDIPGPRKGLLAVISNKKFNLKDLPPLPSDTSRFSASTMEVDKLYDALLNIIESAVGIFAPDQVENIRPGLQAIENTLGVKFREDIFNSFGDLTVTYSAPSEGPFGLGSTTLLQVKDGTKLMRSIETLVKNLPNSEDVEVSLKKKKYRDVEIMDVYLKVQKAKLDSRIASLAVYKGWLVYSGYPQGIKGFVLRSNGELPTWKAPKDLDKVLAEFKMSEYSGIAVSNPKHTVEFLLALTPGVVDLLNRLTPFVPNLRPFDLDVIPHAQQATLGLLPTVTITTDDGKRIHVETRSSIGLP